MRTLATIVAFATFVAAPAFAQSPKSAAEVVFGNKIVGQDPDPGIRSQLMRDYSTHAGGGSE
jgi:hypothetical protein